MSLSRRPRKIPKCCCNVTITFNYDMVVAEQLFTVWLRSLLSDFICESVDTFIGYYFSYSTTMVPTGTGNQGKPGKMGRHFPVREKSGNFVKTGKVREFYSKYWNNWKKLYWKIEKNTGKVREICQPAIVKTL